MNSAKTKEKRVAIVLPYVGNKVLMQLRDVKNGIIFPGQWGFFGGSIRNGETPDYCAKRELFEEIAYSPKKIYKLSIDRYKLPKAGDCISYSFYCPLTVPVEDVRSRLSEGLDFALVSLKDILSKEVYSAKMRRYYPVIALPYIANTVRKLLDRVKII